MTKRTDDAKVDQAAKDSFPASDPPAHTGIVGPGSGRERAEPKGRPTSDRHDAETAHVREDQKPR